MSRLPTAWGEPWPGSPRPRIAVRPGLARAVLALVLVTLAWAIRLEFGPGLLSMVLAAASTLLLVLHHLRRPRRSPPPRLALRP